MQAAQHVARRARVVVLHKLGIDTGLGHVRPVVALEKEAPLIAEHPRFQQQHAQDWGGCNLDLSRLVNASPTHQNTRSRTMRVRYAPYPLMFIVAASLSTSSAPMYPSRNAISSGQATF